MNKKEYQRMLKELKEMEEGKEIKRFQGLLLSAELTNDELQELVEVER